MRGSKQKWDRIGSAVLTFIGNKQTNKQTNKHPDTTRKVYIYRF